MHVLHVIDALSLGGAERMAVEIANRTVADRHRVSVCVTRSGIALAPQLDPRIELIVLGRTSRAAVRPLVRLARWSERHRVDVAHCHGRSSFALVAVLKAAGLYRRSTVLHDHKGIEIDPSIPIWFRIAARYLSAFVGVYPRQLSWAQQAGVQVRKTHLIPNAIDMERVATQELRTKPLAEAPGRSRLIYIGGLRREKAVDVLLEAIAIVRAPIILSIVGGDTDRAYATRCRERAARADLADRVEFLGQRADALALARDADLGVHSSRSESGPLVLVEYAAIGLPFVSTAVGGVAMGLAELGAGRFVPPEDPTALATAIDEMLALSPTARRQLGSSWRAAAKGLYDISIAMPRWYEIYREVMNPE